MVIDDHRVAGRFLGGFSCQGRSRPARHGSGAVFQLIDDPGIIAFWLPLSEISICEQTGYYDGQIVNYYEIRNADSIGVVRAVAAR